MYRRTDITAGGSSIAKWSFWGPSRVAELSLGNGLICTHLNDLRTRSAKQELSFTCVPLRKERGET